MLVCLYIVYVFTPETHFFRLVFKIFLNLGLYSFYNLLKFRRVGFQSVHSDRTEETDFCKKVVLYGKNQSGIHILSW